MTQPAPPPTLTPQFCFSTIALRDFLRLSRALDDGITQSLNALITPATAGFDPSSTSVRTPQVPDSRRINQVSCQNFKNNVLFPSWQARSDVLAYCASVAVSPDPQDPKSVLRNIGNEGERGRTADDKLSPVDDRLDPYSSRMLPSDSRTDRLAVVVRQERSVENIIRARSWGLVMEKCGEDLGDWEPALNHWREGKERDKE